MERRFCDGHDQSKPLARVRGVLKPSNALDASDSNSLERYCCHEVKLSGSDLPLQLAGLGAFFRFTATHQCWEHLQGVLDVPEASSKREMCAWDRS